MSDRQEPHDDRAADPVAPEPETPPQIDDATWYRMSPKYMVVGTIRNLRGLVLPAGFLLISGGGRDERTQLIWIGIGLALGAIAGLFSLLEWRFFRYTFTPRELVVRSGVFQKHERVVPYGRIQAIDLEESPLERLVGIVRVKVDTAAGGSGDIRIDALERPQAQRLREELAVARARAQGNTQDTAQSTTSTRATETAADVPITQQGELLRRLSTGELLALGATSGRIGPAAAFAGAFLQFGTELFPESLWQRVPWQRAEALTAVEVLVPLVLTVAVIAWLLAIATTALTFARFELRRSGDQLLVSHGLLDRRRTTIPIQRIQAIVVGEPLLRQPFRCADIRFASAGGSATEGAQADSGVLFPFLPIAEVEGLLQRAAPEFATDPTTPMTEPLPARALRRYVLSATIGWVIFVGVLMLIHRIWSPGLLDRVTAPQIGLLLLALPLFAALGWARWRDGGWSLAGDTLLMRWRAVGRSTMTTRAGRIQGRTITSDVFQRRADLATARVSVAAGGAGGHYALPHADATETERLMARLGGPTPDIEIIKVPLQPEASVAN